MEIRELKLATRKLIKDANHTVINLIGLTISISFSFLIFLYVIEQSSYDEQIPDAQNIYRIASDFRINGHQDIYSNAPRPMGTALVDEFPSIVAATKIIGYNGLQIHSGFVWYDEKHVKSEHLFTADSNFLKVFNLPLIQGNTKSLHNPNSVIISESMAVKLFGEEEAMGKTIKLENQSTAQVTAIFKDLPNATYMPFEMVISYTTFYPSTDSEIWWYGGHVYTYVKTTDSFDQTIVMDQWDDFFNKYMKKTFDGLNGTASIIFQPLLDLHLWQEYIWEPYPHGSKTNIRTFTLIGIFLLLVAAFNYTNLSLSHAFYRQEEMRTKRILGASKGQIIMQNLTESVITSFLVALLSFSLIGTLMPMFNNFIGYAIPMTIAEPSYLAAILGMSILVTALTSIYPSLKIANMASTETPQNNLIIRKLFVTGQLSIAFALITSTVIVINQLAHVKGMDMGFNKDNLIVIPVGDRSMQKDLAILQHTIRELPGVVNCTPMDETPVSGVNEFTYQMQNGEGEFISNPSQTLEVGYNFLATMDMNLLAGRKFKKEDNEYRGVIINEFLATKMGYDPHQVVGAKIRFGNDDLNDRKVIGVVKDFKMGSAQEPRQAMTIAFREKGGRNLAMRLSESNQQETIRQIKAQWDHFGSAHPFQYTFMDDEFDELLTMENRLFELLVIGSVLIIFISCLGLVGLVAHIVAQRTKEIGIRKVVGAPSYQLYFLLQKDFLKTYTAALIVGSLAAWFFSQGWLENYSYRISIDAKPFAITALLSFAIVLVTLSFHTLRVIRANPVHSLRDE